ncbi:integrase, catalytic region, zinc finger, CCHC-type containing protein, partial [Tanacetum coccineum]
GIEHQTSSARTPEQNGIVERRNRTLVEAARTMLSSAKVPLFFWDEAIVTACFTQNRSLIIPRHEKTPYHIINGQKPVFYSMASDQFCSDPVPQCLTMALEQDSLSPVPQNSPPLNIPTTPAPASQAPIQIPSVTPTENINQAESQDENVQVKEDEFVNILSTPTKDHPLEQVIGNLSQLIRTRRQLETDGEMCMLALTVSRTKPKNIKEAMDDSAWIEAM